jgi:hypothetical protein
MPLVLSLAPAQVEQRAVVAVGGEERACVFDELLSIAHERRTEDEARLEQRRPADQALQHQQPAARVTGEDAHAGGSVAAIQTTSRALLTTCAAKRARRKQQRDAARV